mmetsp:Transcript_21438/g.68989  ORF Transcript_21438/g.68989 Transcript_21438/m.68989 type:complete len:371 (+) Transcript_21438:30-1142(+)
MQWLRVSFFAAASCVVPTTTLNFLSVGDWGDTEAKTYHVAELMGEYAEAHDAQFVIAIGDNMYDTGVTSVNDGQFQSKFEDTFTAAALQVPFYVTSGNHDYYGSVDAQIEYTERSSRWTFPNYYYKRVIEKDGISIALISIDTWRLNAGDTYVKFDTRTNTGVVRDVEKLRRDLKDGKLTEGAYQSITRTFSSSKKKAAPLLGEKEEEDLHVAVVQQDFEQLEQIEIWLEETVRDANDWVLVQGHFPIYSCTTGEHGNTPVLITDLLPLLVEYNVTAYFSGHDHVLQHINRGGLHMFGSGTGARSHTGINVDFPGLVHADHGIYGFMLHKADKTTFQTTFVVNNDGQAEETYAVTISKQQTTTPAPLLPK